MKTSLLYPAAIGLSLLPACNSKQPDFVFFLVDDLGWADVGCDNPNTFYETPTVDHLAQQGVRFTNGYASCPVCSPTRASILTGKYPARLHITDWIPGMDPKNRKLLGPKDLNALPSKEITLAEQLKKAGYITCHIGKWHLGPKGSWPEDHGFDINIGGWEAGSPRGSGYYSPYGNPNLPDGPKGEFLTTRLTNEAINFIKNNRDKPFFLYFAFYTVHTPIQASKNHIQHFKNKREELYKKMNQMTGVKQQRPEHDGFTKLIQDNAAYASMIAAMDESVGRVLALLDELRLRNNTYIIFTSDNGGLSTLRKRGYPTSNLPLRAGKGWCYEGGLRVPLIIDGPGIKPAIRNEPVISTDFYPTILELTGLPLHPEQHMDGISLYPLLKKRRHNSGPAMPENGMDRAIFWHYPHYHGSTWTPGAAMRKGDWKLIEFYDYETVELYNLKNDPGETTDLAGQNPEKTEELLKQLHAWQKETGADFAIPNPTWKGNSGNLK